MLLRSLREIFSTPLWALAGSLFLPGALQARDMAPLNTDWSDPDFFRPYFEQSAIPVGSTPSINSEEQAVMQLANELADNEQRKEAINALRAAITPESSAALEFSLGIFYYQEEEFDLAVQYFREATRKFPNFMPAYKLMGFIFIQREQYSQSIEAFKMVNQLGGADGQTFGLMGLANLNNGDFVASETAYRKAILADPDQRDWYNGLVNALIQLDKNIELIGLYDELITANPSDDIYWLLQANAYLGLQMPEKAAYNYEMVYRMGKAKVESMQTLGDIYVNLGQVNLATDAYIASIDINPGQEPEESIQSLEILNQRGSWVNAERLYLHILDTFADDRFSEEQRLRLLKVQAEFLIATERGDEAVATLERIVSIDATDTKALVLLAQYEAGQENWEKAYDYYGQAVDSAEDSAKVSVLVEYAQLLVKKEVFSDAIPLLEQAQEIEFRGNVQSYLERVRAIERQQRIR